VTASKRNRVWGETPQALPPRPPPGGGAARCAKTSSRAFCVGSRASNALNQAVSEQTEEEIYQLKHFS
jgi:hypothetical protein